MTKALMMSLKDWYSQQTERWPVRRVQLLVGEFTCVEPDLLRTAFAKQKLGTFLENAEIAIRDSPFIAFCRNCEREYKPDINLEYGCPECRAPLDEIRSGRELKIEKVDWDIPVGAER
ncbi:MAG: hydrogenase nickel insertion protein HypA [Capsulimonas sp.]|nr:hydrogenase nickel insertion protein HypA [Capsulimonas sp.]